LVDDVEQLRIGAGRNKEKGGSYGKDGVESTTLSAQAGANRPTEDGRPAGDGRPRVVNGHLAWSCCCCLLYCFIDIRSPALAPNGRHGNDVFEAAAAAAAIGCYGLNTASPAIATASVRCCMIVYGVRLVVVPAPAPSCCYNIYRRYVMQPGVYKS